VDGADVVYSDTFVSMGQESDRARRIADLHSYQVDTALMAKAAPTAIFMHCLPAHRGEEVTAEVIDGPQSVVFDQAENRLHAQKALMVLLLEARGLVRLPS
jgi:ornithine carbamoyltransferase